MRAQRAEKTFHAIYERMPADFKAELIGGIVYVPAALGADHGDVHADVMAWLGTYKAARTDNLSNLLVRQD